MRESPVVDYTVSFVAAVIERLVVVAVAFVAGLLWCWTSFASYQQRCLLPAASAEMAAPAVAAGMKVVVEGLKTHRMVVFLV